MSPSINAAPEGRGAGKGNAARLPNDAYEAIKTIREILATKPCQITVKVFGPHKGPYWRVVEIMVDGKMFLYRRYSNDLYSPFEEFVELLQKKMRSDAKTLVTKTLVEILREDFLGRIIELWLEDKKFVPTEEFIRW
jgi:hypothetical protein